jgi:pimeloyl-ACP methyl ester carboxylesterase
MPPSAVPDACPVRYDELPVHGNLVRYATAGDDGPVVVLVHGIASRARQWERVMGVLGRTHRVIAPDLLGHGESAKPRGDYSLGAHACGIRDLLAALGHDRVTLVGHSLGGGIAMQFSYQFPERVERLALVDAGGLGPEVSPFLRAATLPGSELVLPLIAGSWVRAAGRGVARGLDRAGITIPEGLAESLVGFGSLGDPATREAFIHTARSVLDVRGQRVDARDRLYLAADLPLLVVWGARDAIIPVRHGRDLCASLPSARLEVFEQSGHFPHLTEPDRLARVLHDWLTTTEAAELDPSTLTERLRHPAATATA